MHEWDRECPETDNNDMQRRVTTATSVKSRRVLFDGVELALMIYGVALHDTGTHRNRVLHGNIHR